MAKFQIVVDNTPEQIEEFKTEQKRLPVHCRNCRSSYRRTIGEMIENPTCPKCGK